jgi:hypothetical protein
MHRPSLATLILVTLLLSLVSVVMPWLSVMTLGRLRLLVTGALAILALVAAFATAVYAILVHGRRGFWVLLAAVPALFWPTVTISIVTACTIEDCD